jgi:hypothetical protein
MRSTVLAIVVLAVASSAAGTQEAELRAACMVVQRIARDGDAVLSAPRPSNSADLRALRQDLDDAAAELATLAAEMSDRSIADPLAAVAYWNLALEPPPGVEVGTLRALASDVLEICRWSGHDIGPRLGPASLLEGNLSRPDG